MRKMSQLNPHEKCKTIYTINVLLFLAPFAAAIRVRSNRTASSLYVSECQTALARNVMQCRTPNPNTPVTPIATHAR